MLVSTRGRYALRVMADLAENSCSCLVPMKEVAERQEISLKYIEKIMPSLVKSGLVEGHHGKGGGYRLSREPKDYTVGEILRLAEGGLHPVSCIDDCSEPCFTTGHCRAMSIWHRLDEIVNDYLDGITLEDFISMPDRCIPAKKEA